MKAPTPARVWGTLEAWRLKVLSYPPGVGSNNRGRLVASVPSNVLLAPFFPLVSSPEEGVVMARSRTGMRSTSSPPRWPLMSLFASRRSSRRDPTE